MGKFNQEEFNRFMIENNIVGFFKEPVKLKSGRLSNWYVNWRNVQDVYLMDQLTDYVIAFVEELDLQPDCFYGVPEGATKLGILTQYKWAKKSPNYGPGSHPIPMGRGKSKDHGTLKDRHFIGVPKGKTIIIEDVTTTGNSLLDKIGNLKELKEVEIIHALGLTNRMELTPIPNKDKTEVVEKFKKIFERTTGKSYEKALSVKEAIKEAGVPYSSLSNALQLLPKLNLDEEIAKSIKKEFQEVGIEEINMV